MSNLVKRPWFLLPLLILAWQTSWGQAPSGQVGFSFTSPSTAVYDLAGTYEFDQDIIGTGGTTTPLSIPGLVLGHDRTGRLSGKGTIIIWIGDSPVAAAYTASGRVSGGGNRATRVQLSLRLSGYGTVAGVDTGFSISVRYNWTVDPNTLLLEGPARGHISFTRMPGSKIDTENMTVSLQSGVDGTWRAQFEVLPMNQLTGSGNLILSNGRKVPVRVSGSFISASQLSKVRLTGYYDGDNDGRGSTVRLNFFPEGVDTVSGTILGQKVAQ